MTEETRRSIFRYGIAVDLVILATGVGMLFPLSPRTLIVVFVAAVALAVWKGGWKAGGVAVLLSFLALAFVFPGELDAARLIEFTGAAVAAGAIVAAANTPRVRIVQPVAAANVVAFTAAPQPVIDHEEAARESHERHRLARSLEESAARQIERLREEAERARRAAAERAMQEREAAERAAQEEARRLAEEQRRTAEDETLREAEKKQRAAEARSRKRAEKKRLEEERLAAERQREEQALTEQLIREREEAQRALEQRLEAERKAAEDELRQRLEAEREALRAQMEAQLAAERAAIEREAAARVEAARKEAEEAARRAAETTAAAQRAAEASASAPAVKKAPPAPPFRKPSILDSVSQTVSGWFQKSERLRAVNLSRRTGASPAPKRIQTAAPARRTTARSTAAPAPRKPRLLLIERRRATADTVAPRLKQRGVEVSVVERWVDAVDEIFRARPHAVIVDSEHPDFEKMHRTISDKYNDLPLGVSGRNVTVIPLVRRAAVFVRPYDADELVRLAERAFSRPEDLLAEQAITPQPPAPPVKTEPRPQPKPVPAPVAAAPAPRPPRPVPAARAPEPVAAAPVPANRNTDEYLVGCFSCRVPFDAVEADWCSCLAKERTLVCTNCLSCFCKAPPAYKEKFWVQAPPKLFERKTSEARRQQNALPSNPDLEEIKRPLVLTVEDDEEIQAIVQRVCSNLGYGFIYATNGQDGLDVARAYRPNLILSDAFMPKLDGREMCRILKESNEFDCKMVVMTGLYTDTKYRSEALKRFHVDDYISKPVAITDLVNLLQKHLEGVTGLPAQEDLHELHRQDVEIEEDEIEQEPEPEEIALADLLNTPQTIEVRAKPATQPRRDSYQVCCFNCQNTFDATRAEWCTCVGRDQTVVCPHCAGCFCKAPAAYKERFWMDAPPSLFERKMLGSKRHHGERANPTPSEVKRPLILLVEDDENVQLIVKTVVTTMGFGFVVGANGQEGLSLAREYNPDLILSDAFMPKLDGREMCRLLKEDPTTSRTKAIIMTGLYTDRKYRNEALDYFKVDDYVAKPLAVDDLIKLFKKHLPQEVQTAN
jgi:DNA-binding response OmpR family regulator